MRQRIEVNHLPNPTGSVFGLALWGTVIFVLGNLIPLFLLFFNSIDNELIFSSKILSAILSFPGLVLICLFYHDFSIACYSLEDGTSKDIKKFVNFSIITFIVYSIDRFLPKDFLGLISLIFIVFPIICLIYYCKVAINFKKNFSGKLQKVGKLMLNQLYISISLAVLIILLLFVFIYIIFKVTLIGFELSTFIIIGLVIIMPLIVASWIILFKQYSLMDELMEQGYQAWMRGEREIVSPKRITEYKPTVLHRSVLAGTQRNYHYSSTYDNQPYIIDEYGNYFPIESYAPPTRVEPRTQPTQLYQRENEISNKEDKGNTTLFTFVILTLCVIFVVLIIYLLRLT